MAHHDPVARHWSAAWFTGKTVLVTGGTSGIGAGISRGFAEAGAKLVCTGVTGAEIEAARQDPLLSAARIERLDVRDRVAVERLVSSILELDVVVNCAGVIRRGEELDPDVFADVVDINLTGSMRVCAAARPKLAERGGSIVNVASMLSFFGGGLVPGYSASKGGIVQMTKSLAIAYAQEGIRVNAIAPGWIETSLTRELQQDEGRRTAIINRTPLRRWGKPEDLVGGVLFLCSPVAGFITGTILPIDGGYLIA
ncbi:SDR family NAD(P)-dependent oxidoreductase [Rhizobium sp. LCM 4573]|uniref:SDR family NAD(P)-dependent oxidoreductase n=1 Tax=Rhizobium sp. LCM 4573 TaxID=1848291 RepID=UPI0008DA6E78|nr:SDR family NAD(P)-dependent oxidoreductase [Rhizobium sp. LCM 4573]OHV80468.1 2-deoxy-D-gluconate 3-dehydrogenase [Rhizobium sp. LCM 4573]